MKISSRCCIGGTDARADKDALRKGGVQIVVGTPGRIKDMIEKQALRTDFIKAVVLDEADEMLSRGFVDDVKSIF
jgi:superfamily II DNA/RNA helicase